MGPWQAVVDMARRVAVWACNQHQHIVGLNKVITYFLIHWGVPLAVSWAGTHTQWVSVMVGLLCRIMAALARCDGVGIGGPACGKGWMEVTATGLRQRRQKVLEGWGSMETPLAWVGEVGGLKDSGAVAAKKNKCILIHWTEAQLIPAAWQWLACLQGTPMGACNGSSKTVKQIKKEKEKTTPKGGSALEEGESWQKKIEPPPDTVSIRVVHVQLGRTRTDINHKTSHCHTTAMALHPTTMVAGRQPPMSLPQSNNHKDDDHDNGCSNGPGCGGTNNDDNDNDNGAVAGGIGGGDWDGDGGSDSERSDGDGDGDVGSGDTDVDGDNRDQVAMVVMGVWVQTVGTQMGTILLLVHILSYK
ncbi:hypothetical protein EDB83DRAFT_2325477 [Lactarius deliciosus]|nr:hypothetical protein EDB83DRAFT_2325477 [Lactarius deliciosus]